jgi:hypothetical protein
MGLSYSKIIKLPDNWAKKVKIFKRDNKIIQGHRKNDFKLIIAWLHVSWITLLVTFILSPVLHWPEVPPMVQFINAALWFLCFEAVICINLGVDLYIILFANNPVIGKVAQVCFLGVLLWDLPQKRFSGY